MRKRLTCMILAFILLLSTAGVFVSKHFCQNELKSTALYGLAKPCHSGMKGTSCPMHPNSAAPMKKGCCDDQSTFVKSDSDQIIAPPDVQPDLLELGAIAVTLPTHLSSPDRRIGLIKFFNHKPPLILFNKAAMLQTFRF